MKVKMVLLIALTLFLYGCATGASGQIPPPANDGYGPGMRPSPAVLEYTFRPEFDMDWGLTLFSVRGIQIRVLPMTRGARSAGADQPAEELDDLIQQNEARLLATPQDFETYLVLATLHLKRGRNGDADAAFNYSNLALGIRTGDPGALYLRGLANQSMGDRASRTRALDDFTQVLNAGIEDVRGIYYVIGIIHLSDDNVSEAINAFESITAIDPNFADTHDILDILRRR